MRDSPVAYAQERSIVNRLLQELPCVTTHTQVSGKLPNGTLVRHSAYNWDTLALGLDRYFSQHDPGLLDSDDADKRADSLLSALTRRRLQAAITAPANVGQELHDVIAITHGGRVICGQEHRLLGVRVRHCLGASSCEHLDLSGV